MMIVVNGGETRYYYHYDGLGSVVALSNNSGSIIEKYSYDAFGAVTIRDAGDQILTNSNFGNCRMFTGRELDSETGNYYYRSRYYQPNIGRFLQPDPIGYADSMNLYQYCLNNPVNYWDPFGLDTYTQNRKIGGDTASSKYNPITHEFTFTTNPDGSLKDTFSWGNTYDENGKGNWHKNRPEDRKAAEEGLKNGSASKVGNSSLDPYIEEAYEDKLNEEKHEWELWDNCRTETGELIFDAKYKKGGKKSE